MPIEQRDRISLTDAFAFSLSPWFLLRSSAQVVIDPVLGLMIDDVWPVLWM